MSFGGYFFKNFAKAFQPFWENHSLGFHLLEMEGLSTGVSYLPCCIWLKSFCPLRSHGLSTPSHSFLGILSTAEVIKGFPSLIVMVSPFYLS
jgi:hypothetical protein